MLGQDAAETQSGVHMPSHAALRLSASRLTVQTTCAQVQAARAEFAHSRALLIPGLLTADFLALLHRVWSVGRFDVQQDNEVGQPRVEASERCGAALSLALSQRGLLEWLQDVTGVAPLGSVEGGVIQFQAGQGAGLLWHDDLNRPFRQLAMTLNLGTASYDGGVFELRRKGEEALLMRHHHTGAGDALVFAVDGTLEHRVTPVSSGGPRTVFAGWVFQDHRR